jgi:hypothetical protein
MTSTLQLQRRLRRIAPAIVIVVGLVLISAVLIQQVVAQDSGTLKPPFRLIQPANLAAPLSGVQPLPLSAPIIMSETFGNNFSYNFVASDTGAPWHLVNASGVVDVSHTWGRVAGAPITDTLWNAGTTPLGGNPISAGQPYTKNMQAYAIYGPIDMTDYTTALISVTYAMDTMDTLGGDPFGVAYSTNGTDFTIIAATYGRDPSLALRHTSYYPLPDEARWQKHVWIALIFTSQNRDNIDALGVYVEDVVVRGNPALKVYVPLVRRDATPTPTATPQVSYVYSYTFGSGLNTDPQFLTWGGKVDDANCYIGSVNCKWTQGIVTNGHPGGAVNISQNGLNSIAGASPNNTAPTDFELSADFYVVQGKSDARLGLLFNAGSATFGRNNGKPTFDPNSKFYKFDLQFNESDNTIMSYYRLQYCDENINGCTNLVEKASLPSGLVGNTGTWNKIVIQRLGDNIKVYVNDMLLVDRDDGTRIGSMKYGIFLQTKNLNSTGNPIKIRFDNVLVRALP